MENKNKKYSLWILLFIIALAFFLRIVNIGNTPPGIYPDEAVNGQDALRALNSGKFEWFYPDNQGREGLFMNLIALCFKLFGVSVLTLKLPAIIFGTLTVLGTYFLARELFNQRVGLISSFLVAVSFWPLNFSRISFRANMLPFVLVFSFYFIWKGLRTRKWTDFAIGGFIFGIGLHTYIAFRIAPAILVVVLLSLIISRPDFFKEYWRKILVFIIFVAIAASPMLYTFLISHPEYFESRSGNISIFSPTVNRGHIIQTFLRSFGLSLAKYNFVGDFNWLHNYPPYPILDPLTGIAFLFGIIYSFLRLLGFLKERIIEKIKNPSMDKYIFLIVWFFAMLAPEFLTAEGNPHSLRSIGTIPVVFIFSGLTFDYLFKKSEKYDESFRKASFIMVIITLLVIATFNAVKYHYVWAKKVETARSFEKVLRDISAYIETIPLDKEVFVVTGNMQRVPVRVFAWGRPNYYDLHPNDIDKIYPKDTNNFEIIFTDLEKDNIIKIIKSKFPNLELQEFKDQLGIKYYILK